MHQQKQHQQQQQEEEEEEEEKEKEEEEKERVMLRGRREGCGHVRPKGLRKRARCLLPSLRR